MNDTEYKIEKHLPPSFPIYTSIQRGRENLVHNHCHSSMEIIKVLEGRIKLQIGAFYYECRKGDIIFINEEENSIYTDNGKEIKLNRE